jgi:hypothetical protein
MVVDDPPVVFCVLYFGVVLHYFYKDYCNHSERNNGTSFLFKNLPVWELEIE